MFGTRSSQVEFHLVSRGKIHKKVVLWTPLSMHLHSRRDVAQLTPPMSCSPPCSLSPRGHPPPHCRSVRRRPIPMSLSLHCRHIGTLQCRPRICSAKHGRQIQQQQHKVGLDVTVCPNLNIHALVFWSHNDVCSFPTLSATFSNMPKFLACIKVASKCLISCQNTEPKGKHLPPQVHGMYS